MFSGGLMLARGPALPLTLLPPEACAHKNDHARTKSAPPTELKSRGKKAKQTVCIINYYLIINIIQINCYLYNAAKCVENHQKETFQYLK